jgi:peptidoglycan/LPS O-acetylase OafA/YrhL
MKNPSRTPALTPNGVAFLDMLRAIGANLVLLGHTSAILGSKSRLASSGTIGVIIFFILSGFLILQSSVSRLQKPLPHFAPYMIDRTARIFTAYLPVLLLVAGVNAILPLGHWGQAGTSKGVLAFLGNLLLLQDYPAFQLVKKTIGDALYIRPYNTAEPFWTIPIEFWIYVVFGVAFFSLFNQERIRHPVLGGLCIVALPVVIWNAAAGGGNGLSLVWLIGAASGYVWATAWISSQHKVKIGVAVSAAAAICLLGRGEKTGWNFQDIGMAISLAVFMLGGLSVVEGIGHLPRAARGACTFLASYSYSLYLVHNTVLVIIRETLPDRSAWATIPLALFAAHGVAVFVYLAFERHYRHVGKWLKHTLLAPNREGLASSLTP